MINKNKVFLRMFLSYIVIIIMPIIIIGGINFIKITDMVKNDVKRDNMSLLKQAMNTINMRFRELDNLSYELSSNSNINSLLYSLNPLDVNKRLLIMDIMKDISVYRAPNGFISDIYLYFKTNDIIISDSGMYNTKMFYDFGYGYKGMSYKKWHEMIYSYHYRDYKPVQKLSRKGVASLFLQSIPENDVNAPGTLMIYIDVDQYNDVFTEIVKNNNGYYYVLNNKGKIMTTSDKKGLFNVQVVNNISGGDGFANINSKLGKMVITYVTSDYNGWKYISIVPLSIFMIKIKDVEIFTILIIAFCLMIGLIISYFAANKNYSPIRDIVDYIKQVYGNTINGSDDYKVISDVLHEWHHEIVDKREEIKKHLPILRQNFFLKLLKGKAELGDINILMQTLNIDLDFKLSTVILFQINEYRIAIINNQTDMALMRYAAINVIEKMANNQGIGYAIELDNDEIALIYGEKGNTLNEQNLKTLIEKIKLYLETKMHLVISTGVGSIYRGHDDLSKAYEEAKEAIKYTIINDRETVFYRCIKKREDHYSFPIQVEMKLSNFVKAGDEQNALKLIDELFQENVLNKKLSYELLKCFIYDIYSTLIKTAEEINVLEKYTFFDFDSQFLIKRNIDSIFEKIKENIKNICYFIRKNKKSNNEELAEKIRGYIDENYQKNCLTLDIIAEHFRMSAQYLSRFFKEQTGYNYIDYLRRKRIEAAKSYLSCGKYKVKEVSVMVGFENTNTFIKVFKKYEGITPGQYKVKSG